MPDMYNLADDYHAGRQPHLGTTAHAVDAGEAAHSQATERRDTRASLASASSSASCNAPIRAEAMLQMQQTHGNRAVQRYKHGQVAIPVQRADPRGSGPVAKGGGGVMGGVGAMWDALLNSDFLKGIQKQRIEQAKEIMGRPDGVYPREGEPDLFPDGIHIKSVKNPDGSTHDEFVPPKREEQKCIVDQQGEQRHPDVSCQDPWDPDNFIPVDLRRDKQDEELPRKGFSVPSQVIDANRMSGIEDPIQRAIMQMISDGKRLSQAGDVYHAMSIGSAQAAIAGAGPIGGYSPLTYNDDSESMLARPEYENVSPALNPWELRELAAGKGE